MKFEGWLEQCFPHPDLLDYGEVMTMIRSNDSNRHPNSSIVGDRTL